jgi:site-specific DNA recombinase
MKTVGYIRVSTQNQAEEGISLELQQKKIRAYCELNDLELTEVVVDAGISAKNVVARPGMCKIVDLIKSKKVQHFVVYKLDRMSRSVRDACDLSELMNKNGVHMHSITEKIDTSTATGNLFFQIMACVSEWERRTIGERTKAALQHMKAIGEKVSSRPPYGFEYIDGRAIPVPEEQACIAKLAELRTGIKGLGYKRAAKLLEECGFLNRNGERFGGSSMRVLWKLTCNVEVNLDIAKAA